MPLLDASGNPSDIAIASTRAAAAHAQAATITHNLELQRINNGKQVVHCCVELLLLPTSYGENLRRYCNRHTSVRRPDWYWCAAVELLWKERTMAADEENDVQPVASADENDAESGGSSSSGSYSSRPDRFFQLFTGVRTDLSTRFFPYYASDWGKPRSFSTVVNAIVFAFVVQLIPALIFAELMDKQTEGNLAAAETLLSAGIIGVIYAIISGQPLTLLGITGPVAILLGTSHGLASQFESDYWSFFWWLCMWTALFHFITAITGIVNFVVSVSNKFEWPAPIMYVSLNF